MLAAQDDAAAARALLTPEAVRERCGNIYAAGRDEQLEHFQIVEHRINEAARFVLGVMRNNYPDLNIPYHARWRHFSAGGIERWQALKGRHDLDRRETARAAFELAITSVLLDAGAGAAWRYREVSSGQVLERSEGLAVASLALFEGGGFSADPARPLRADGRRLAAVTADELVAGFQVTGDNPLEGLEGRAGLLRALGAAIVSRDDICANGRLGDLFDYFAARAGANMLPARDILIAVLDLLGPIWPGRLSLGGIALGDVWRHRHGGGRGADAGLVPFHKLSQWLTYSLVEPLEEAGVTVTGLEALTGLAEYRNGGLFIDTGVLVPRHDAVTGLPHGPEDEVIVEWRALSVILLDLLADAIRRELGRTPEQLPLARVLEGGSWAAGRVLAGERRNGAPPITLLSDGSVF